MAQLTGFDVAGANNAFMTAQKNRTNRAIGGFLDKGNLGSAKSLAFQSGNIKAGTAIDAQMQAKIAKLDAKQKADALARTETLGGIAASLLQFSPQERQQALKPGSPAYNLALQNGLSQNQLDGFAANPTDAALLGVVGQSKEFSKLLKPITVASGAAAVNPLTGKAVFENPAAPKAGSTKVGIINGRRVFVRQGPNGLEEVPGAVPPPPSDSGVGALASEIAQARLDKLNADAKIAKDKAKLGDAKQRQNVTNQINKAVTIVRDGTRALKFIDQNSGSSQPFSGALNPSKFGPRSALDVSKATRRAAAAQVPGTVEFEVNKLIDSMKGNVSIDQLLNIKREGSGLGQVPQQQLMLLARLMGELDIARDPALLRKDIEDINILYSDVIGNRPSSLLQRPDFQDVLGLIDQQLIGEGVIQPDQAIAFKPEKKSNNIVVDINGNPL